MNTGNYFNFISKTKYFELQTKAINKKPYRKIVTRFKCDERNINMLHRVNRKNIF